MITTGEAAKRLGVTRSRVLELIKHGQLEAQKLSGVWFIDESSVSERMRTVSKKGGRPTRGQGRDETEFVLMNRTHEIARVVYSRRRKAFTLVGETMDEQRAPVGIGDGPQISLHLFNDWWSNRGLPRTRHGIDDILRQAGVDVPEELLNRNLGLSLSDQYWIRPKGSGLEWADVNFFNNDFSDVDERIGEFTQEASRAKAHPDNTSDGNLAKRWIVRDGIRVLMKAGHHYNQEPYNEVVATALHRRLLASGEFVAYELENEGSAPHSLCPNFLTDAEEYISAFYVEKVLPPSGRLNDFDHFLECCSTLGVEGERAALERMIVCDDIIANHDRHFRNFGIIRNVETLECRPAPIFDSGSSLWCDKDTAALSKGDFSFTSRQFEAAPQRQLLLVEDFSWFDIGRIDGFVDEAIRILSQNDMLGERMPYIADSLRRRVCRMVDIVEWS